MEMDLRVKTVAAVMLHHYAASQAFDHISEKLEAVLDPRVPVAAPDAHDEDCCCEDCADGWEG